MITVRIMGPRSHRIVAWYLNGQLQTMYRVGTRNDNETIAQIKEGLGK